VKFFQNLLKLKYLCYRIVTGMDTKLLLAASLLPLYKYVRSGRILNTNTVRTNGYLTIYAVGHIFQGIAAGYLLGPGPVVEWIKPYRTFFSVILFFFYPVYNVVKRIKRTELQLFESSIFVNMTDFVIGLLIGFAVSKINCSVECTLSQLGTEQSKSNIELKHKMFIIMLSLSLITIFMSEFFKSNSALQMLD
jgi:hypothetical protein